MLCDGTVSFNWNYQSFNGGPNFDPFGFLVNNGFTQLTDNAGALLQRATELLEDFTELEQWELIKSELLDIRGVFEKNAEPYWSSEIDRDSVDEEYEQRHAQA